MGKTYRRNPLDEQYGCFEDYRRRSSYGPRFGLDILDDDYSERWDYQHDKQWWERRRRDGRAAHHSYRSGGKSKQFYRKLTNTLIRNGTRCAIHRGIETDDWDDLVFPTNWDGKQFIWSVW